MISRYIPNPHCWELLFIMSALLASELYQLLMDSVCLHVEAVMHTVLWSMFIARALSRSIYIQIHIVSHLRMRWRKEWPHGEWLVVTYQNDSLHSAHNSLFNTFTSPFTHPRTSYNLYTFYCPPRVSSLVRASWQINSRKLHHKLLEFDFIDIHCLPKLSDFFVVGFDLPIFQPKQIR